MTCPACDGSGMTRWLGRDNSEEVGPCELCNGTGEAKAQPTGMGALSDREIDDWLLMMERLFGKEFLEGA